MPKPTSHHPYVEGKGSWRRPEDTNRYRGNFDAIFGPRHCFNCVHSELDHARDEIICAKLDAYFDALLLAYSKDPPCDRKQWEAE